MPPESTPLAGEQVGIRSIEQIDRHTLGIEWTDGRRSRWRLSHLRRNCPCATCIDEWTGKPLLKAESISDDIAASKVYSVGRYALGIDFSDGHRTGIYSFGLLRRLDGTQGATAGAGSARPEDARPV